MQIENGLVLVMAGIPNENDSNAPPGYVELYRIDGILALQDYQGHDLSGHPGRDLNLLPGTIHRDSLLNTYGFFHHTEILPGNRVWGCTFQVCKSDIQKIQRIIKRGDMIAVWFNNRRNKHGQTVGASIQVSWRKSAKYLSEDQILWLQAYSASSTMLTGDRDATKAIRNICYWIGEMAKTQPEPIKEQKSKKKKTKKGRRKRSQKQYMETDYV